MRGLIKFSCDFCDSYVSGDLDHDAAKMLGVVVVCRACAAAKLHTFKCGKCGAEMRSRLDHGQIARDMGSTVLCGKCVPARYAHAATERP